MYTCYQSGVHAFCYVAQRHLGPYEALPLARMLWDLDYGDKVMEAKDLSDLLAVFCPFARHATGSPEEVLKAAQGILSAGATVLVRLRRGPLPCDDRWALLRSVSETGCRWGEFVEDVPESRPPGSLLDILQGEMIAVVAPAHPYPVAVRGTPREGEFDVNSL